jgi:hypothetical protein
MTTNISFQCTAGEAQLDELSLRHHPSIASRRMRSRRSVCQWRVISVFRDSVGVRRAQAAELIGLLTEAMLPLNALADEIDAAGTTPI